MDKGEPDMEMFEKFGFVPPVGTKPFDKSKPETQSEIALTWFCFWLPMYCDHFGRDFGDMMEYFFKNTNVGNKLLSDF